MTDVIPGTLNLYCTDRGSHPRSILARLQFRDETAPGQPVLYLRGMDLANHAGPIRVQDVNLPPMTRREKEDLAARARSSPRRVASSEPRQDRRKNAPVSRVGTAWRFVCPRCSRDVQISADRLRRIGETTVTELDLSLLTK